MRASVALNLGRLLVSQPMAFNLSNCAMGMILKADGLFDRVHLLSDGTQRVMAIFKQYPWLAATTPPAFLEKHPMGYPLAVDNIIHNTYYAWIVTNFNMNVMDKRTMTLDRLQAIIAEIEPDCDCNEFNCSCTLDTSIDNLVQEHTEAVEAHAALEEILT